MKKNTHAKNPPQFDIKRCAWRVHFTGGLFVIAQEHIMLA
jgi:hypothetical protein